MSDSTVTTCLRRICGEKPSSLPPAKVRLCKPAVRYLLLAVLTTSAPTLFAQEGVYRSVDEQGNVTYSSSPPKGSVETRSLEISPGPSALEREATRERVKKMESMTQQWVDEREARAKDRQRPPEAMEGPEEELLGPQSTTSSYNRPLRKEVREGRRDRLEERKGDRAPGNPVRIQPVPYPIRKPVPDGRGTAGRGPAAPGRGRGGR